MHRFRDRVGLAAIGPPYRYHNSRNLFTAIKWPNYNDVPVDQFLRIEENQDRYRTLDLKSFKLGGPLQPVEKVGVWSNFRRDNYLSSQIVGRKLGPDPFLLLLFQQAVKVVYIVVSLSRNNRFKPIHAKNRVNRIPPVKPRPTCNT